MPSLKNIKYSYSPPPSPCNSPPPPPPPCEEASLPPPPPPSPPPPPHPPCSPCQHKNHVPPPPPGAAPPPPLPPPPPPPKDYPPPSPTPPPVPIAPPPKTPPRSPNYPPKIPPSNPPILLPTLPPYFTPAGYSAPSIAPLPPPRSDNHTPLAVGTSLGGLFFLSLLALAINYFYAKKMAVPKTGGPELHPRPSQGVGGRQGGVRTSAAVPHEGGIGTPKIVDNSMDGAGSTAEDIVNQGPPVSHLEKAQLAPPPSDDVVKEHKPAAGDSGDPTSQKEPPEDPQSSEKEKEKEREKKAKTDEVIKSLYETRTLLTGLLQMKKLEHKELMAAHSYAKKNLDPAPSPETLDRGQQDQAVIMPTTSSASDPVKESNEFEEEEEEEEEKANDENEDEDDDDDNKNESQVTRPVEEKITTMKENDDGSEIVGAQRPGLGRKAKTKRPSTRSTVKSVAFMKNMVIKDGDESKSQFENADVVNDLNKTSGESAEKQETMAAADDDDAHLEDQMPEENVDDDDDNEEEIGADDEAGEGGLQENKEENEGIRSEEKTTPAGYDERDKPVAKNMKLSRKQQHGSDRSAKKTQVKMNKTSAQKQIVKTAEKEFNKISDESEKKDNVDDDVEDNDDDDDDLDWGQVLEDSGVVGFVEDMGVSSITKWFKIRKIVKANSRVVQELQKMNDECEKLRARRKKRGGGMNEAAKARSGGTDFMGGDELEKKIPDIDEGDDDDDVEDEYQKLPKVNEEEHDADENEGTRSEEEKTRENSELPLVMGEGHLTKNMKSRKRGSNRSAITQSYQAKIERHASLQTDEGEEKGKVNEEDMLEEPDPDQEAEVDASCSQELSASGVDENIEEEMQSAEVKSQVKYESSLQKNDDPKRPVPKNLKAGKPDLHRIAKAQFEHGEAEMPTMRSFHEQEIASSDVEEEPEQEQVTDESDQMMRSEEETTPVEGNDQKRKRVVERKIKTGKRDSNPSAKTQSYLAEVERHVSLKSDELKEENTIDEEDGEVEEAVADESYSQELSGSGLDEMEGMQSAADVKTLVNYKSSLQRNDEPKRPVPKNLKVGKPYLSIARAQFEHGEAEMPTMSSFHEQEMASGDVAEEQQQAESEQELLKDVSDQIIRSEERQRTVARKMKAGKRDSNPSAKTLSHLAKVESHVVLKRDELKEQENIIDESCWQDLSVSSLNEKVGMQSAEVKTLVNYESSLKRKDESKRPVSKNTKAGKIDLNRLARAQFEQGEAEMAAMSSFHEQEMASDDVEEEYEQEPGASEILRYAEEMTTTEGNDEERKRAVARKMNKPQIHQGKAKRPTTSASPMESGVFEVQGIVDVAKEIDAESVKESEVDESFLKNISGQVKYGSLVKRPVLPKNMKMGNLDLKAQFQHGAAESIIDAVMANDDDHVEEEEYQQDIEQEHVVKEAVARNKPPMQQPKAKRPTTAKTQLEQAKAMSSHLIDDESISLFTNLPKLLDEEVGADDDAVKQDSEANESFCEKIPSPEMWSVEKKKKKKKHDSTKTQLQQAKANTSTTITEAVGSDAMNKQVDEEENQEEMDQTNDFNETSANEFDEEEVANEEEQSASTGEASQLSV